MCEGLGCAWGITPHRLSQCTSGGPILAYSPIELPLSCRGVYPCSHCSMPCAPFSNVPPSSLSIFDQCKIYLTLLGTLFLRQGCLRRTPPPASSDLILSTTVTKVFKSSRTTDGRDGTLKRSRSGIGVRLSQAEAAAWTKP